MSNQLIKTLENAFLENALEVDAPQLSKIADFLELVQEWNQTFNLTAHRQLDDLIEKDIIDNLLAQTYIKNYIQKSSSILDVGAGAGFTGVLLSIMNPELQVGFLEANRKKMNFIKQVSRELQLPSPPWAFLQQRADEIQNHQKRAFSAVISRATWPLDELIFQIRDYVQDNGNIIYMGGKEAEMYVKNSNVVFNQPYTIAKKEYKRMVIISQK